MSSFVQDHKRVTSIINHVELVLFSLSDKWLPKGEIVCRKRRLGGAWRVVGYEWSSNKTESLDGGLPTINSSVVVPIMEKLGITLFARTPSACGIILM